VALEWLDDWSVGYFRGALQAARQELRQIEEALGLPAETHIALWGRLDQWDMLVRQYEKAARAVRELYEMLTEALPYLETHATPGADYLATEARKVLERWGRGEGDPESCRVA